MKYVLAALLGLLAVPAHAEGTRPIRIAVDARRAPQRILHAALEIPVEAGPLTLFYAKWMPADHSPDGPISNLAGLEFTAQGKKIPWQQDPVDMFAFHLEIPAGAQTLTASLDFLLTAAGPGIDFADSASARLLVLMWNHVVLYPQGHPATELIFEPTLELPEGWKFNTSLPVAGQSGNVIRFAPVNLDLLIDSPVQSGQFTRVIALSPEIHPPHEVDIAADDSWALDIPPELVGHYQALVREANLLYRSHHYRKYRFLLTLSDNVLRLGQEHHESSDDRVPERTLADPNLRLLSADLFTHEFTHSWNGKYRRPASMTPGDFQKPLASDLIWVYEGLTTYLGTILAARSGLWTAAETRDHIAMLASMLDHRAGRQWRSLQNASNAAQVLYFAPSEWTSYRRGTDFYPESVLVWLEADVTIRKLSGNQRSLDDFCRAFLGGPEELPVIKTYTFDDVVGALNSVAPYDWKSFLRERLDSTDAHAPMGGLTGGGWRLAYTDQPNVMAEAGQQVMGGGDFTRSLGLAVREDGIIQDVTPGMPAFAAGLSPFMKIVSVNDRQFSVAELARAVRGPVEGRIALRLSNAGVFELHQLAYQGGMRNPHLDRIPSATDYLGDILKPLGSK